MNVYEVTHEGVTYVLEEDNEGAYFAYVPDLPGCHSQGDTLDEAVANIKEAFALFVDSAVELDIEIPERYRRLRLQRAS